MPDNSLAPPNMPWLWQPNAPQGQPNGLGPPMLNYAAPPDATTSQGADVLAGKTRQAWQWLQDQRAESTRQGLLDPDTGLPTQKGVVEGLRDTAQGVMMGTTAPGDAPGFSLEQVHPRTLRPISDKPDLGQPGNHAYSIKDPAGEPVGIVDTTWNPDTGNLHIEDFQSEGGPNTLGPAAIRQLRSALLEQYPGVQSLSGLRISGATYAHTNSGSGPGRYASQSIQDVDPATGTTAPGDAPPPGIVAYHGSPHSFDQFDTSKIGTGEGNQAFGYGLYAADQESTAQSYKGGGYTFQGKRLDPAASWSPESAAAGWFEPPKPGETMGDMIARRAQELQDHGDFMAGSTDSRNHGSAQMYYNAAERLRGLDPADWKQAGHMYQVNIGADPEHMLQWDQTVGQHPPALRDKLLDMGYGDTDRGADVYSHMARGKEGDVGASKRLQDAGIPGISYLDQGSRAGGEGTKNHVIFDANTIEILRKYGIAGLIAGGGAAAAATQQQQPSQ